MKPDLWMDIPSYHVDVPGGTSMGKPSKGTRKDRRLKTNRGTKNKRKRRLLRWV